MTKDEQRLLKIEDLSGRLPYGVKATTTLNGWSGVYTVSGYKDNRIYLDCPVYDEGDDEWLIEFVKPYLRPMESMTEEEYREFLDTQTMECGDGNIPKYEYAYKTFDWLNKKMFDYRGLIKLGLALEALEGMYDTK